MTYSVAMLTSQGINRLETFDSYSEAAGKLEDWWEAYPNSWIEVVNDTELEQIAEDD
jgi:hypothetical protein